MAAAAVNPATVMAFVQIGAALLSFAGALFGGKKGAALTDFARLVQGFGQGLLTIPNELQKIMTQIDAVIGAIDQTQLSKLAAVHDQMVGYMLAFPNGVPQNADTGNPNYVQAHQATAEVVSYFQNQQRGPAAMMAALSHSTNSRLELAMTAWPCWSASAGPGQPNFVGEVNLSAGQLSSYVSQMRSPLGAGFGVKKIMPKPSPGGAVRPPVDNVNDGPIDPPEPIGWQVVKDGSEVVWEKRDPAAYSQAQQVAANLRNQRANERLAGYIGTVDRWTQAAARSGSAAIARALDAGDAQVFMRFVNPATLLMEEPAETVQALGLPGSDDTMTVVR